MSNHLHMIARAKDQKLNILFGNFKSFTAKEFIKQIESNSRESRKEWLMHMFKFYGRGNSQNEVYQFWQNGNHPTELWNAEVIKQKINYLHNNPVKQGIVAKPEDYLYSSANEFSEIKVLEL